MTAGLVELIIDNVKELNTQGDLQIPENLNPDTMLFGPDGILDSMALVTLVVAVEQAIEDRFGVTVSLADAKAMSQKYSPFRTIGSLTTYAGGLMGEAGRK
jgi:acyl carrier protein